MPPPTKRRRPTAGPPAAAAPQPPPPFLPPFRPPAAQLASLLAWLPTAGIRVHDESIRLEASASGGVRVVAVRDLTPGTPLASIPKTAVLSCESTAVAPVLSSARLAGGLGLAVAVAAEVAAGEASPWAGYLSSLPAAGENLPALAWPPAALAAAAGSDLPSRAAADAAAVAEDFEAEVIPLIPELVAALQAAYGGGGGKGNTTKKPTSSSSALPPASTLTARLSSLPLFSAATSWVASRSFGVDKTHGRSMVALADAFNHKAAVVEVGEGWAVERVCFADSEGEEEGQGEEDGDDGDDEEEEGGGGGGGEGASSSSSDDEGEGEEGEPGPSPAWPAPPPRADGLSLELAICGGSMLIGPPPGQPVPALECVAASAVKKGAEVHNTYGEHGAPDLAARYGFALPSPVPGPFDAVGLRVGDLLTAAERAVEGGSARAARARARLLAATDLLDPSGSGEPLEVSSGGVVGAGLRVVLLVLGATDGELSGWGGNLEAAVAPRKGRGASSAPLGPVTLSAAAAADPPLTPRAAAILATALHARLEEYPQGTTGLSDAGAVAAAAAAVKKAAAAVDARPTPAATAALRTAQALLTARIVVRAEKAVLVQALAGAAVVCGVGE